MGQLNLSFYRNRNSSVYSCLNKIDSYVMQILKKTTSDLSNYIPNHIKYFLNPLKKNLVKDLDFRADDEVLAVNDVFGILTEELSPKVKSVTLIEFSKPIADVTANKLSQADNVEIVVGWMQDIEIEKKFDYIILTDILEFSKMLMGENFSYNDMILKFKNLLKPNGKLILNISNQLGIKNWAGACEEHFGKVYGSLQNYSGVNAKLFSKPELYELFRQCGFEDIDFYYPIPTHYAPEKVISDKDVVTKDFSKCYQNYSLYTPKHFFDERILMEDIIENGKFYLFVNSFMVIAKNGGYDE